MTENDIFLVFKTNVVFISQPTEFQVQNVYYNTVRANINTQYMNIYISSKN